MIVELIIALAIGFIGAILRIKYEAKKVAKYKSVSEDFDRAYEEYMLVIQQSKTNIDVHQNFYAYILHQKMLFSNKKNAEVLMQMYSNNEGVLNSVKDYKRAYEKTPIVDCSYDYPEVTLPKIRKFAIVNN